MNNYDSSKSLIEEFVLDAVELLFTVDQMIDDSIGDRYTMLNLRSALADALAELDPNDDLH